jgi:uncharacterized protein YggE
MKLLATALMLAVPVLATAPLSNASAQNAPSVEPMVPASGTVLDVSATGRTTRVPDVAMIRSGVMTQDATATVALSDNSDRMARVLAALKSAGVAGRDIATANVSLSPQYRYADHAPPVITGYQASNTVSVRFRDIAKAGAILDALVKQGANQIDGPNLSLDKPEAALDEARADAVKVARERAELYAKAAGMSVARIVSIGEGGENAGNQPPMPQFRMLKVSADSAPTQIVSGETDVTVTLNVRFLLK